MRKRQIGVMIDWFPDVARAEAKVAELERLGYVVGERYPDRVWMALPDIEPEPDPEEEAMWSWMEVLAEGVTTMGIAGACALFLLSCFTGMP